MPRRVPWRTALISGWGLTEQGKKLSKRNLDSSAGPDGYNRYVPDDVMGKYVSSDSTSPYARFNDYWSRWTDLGVHGDARPATAEKGEVIFEAAVNGLVEMIAEWKAWPIEERRVPVRAVASLDSQGDAYRFQDEPDQRRLAHAAGDLGAR